MFLYILASIMPKSNEILSAKMGRNNANYIVDRTNILGIVITISAYHYVQIVQVECNVTTFNLKNSAFMHFS